MDEPPMKKKRSVRIHFGFPRGLQISLGDPDDASEPKPSPAPKSLAERTLDLLTDACWVPGLYVIFTDPKKFSPRFILFATAGMLAAAFNAGLKGWRKQRFLDFTGVALPLLIAFGLVTSRKQITSYPWWLSVVALVVAGVDLFGAVPIAVVLWRRQADERDRAIAFSSMAFALLATLVVAFAFSAMKGADIGPALQPDWILYTGGGAWVAAWFFLRSRM